MIGTYEREVTTLDTLKKLTALLLAALLVLGLTGCAMDKEDIAAIGQVVTEVAAALEEASAAEGDAAENALPAEEAPADLPAQEQSPEQEAEPEPEAEAEPETRAAVEPEPEAEPEAEPETEPETESEAEAESALDPDGWYTTKEDVALYLHLYGELPGNFITKTEARELGWSGGGLDGYADGKSIGGDRFGNYEGILPDGNYHECDINTMHASSRGAERIVYSDDGRIYYTNDHYESYTLLYGEE